MQRYLCLTMIVMLAGHGAAFTPQTPHRQPPVEVFATLGFTAADVAAIDAGRPVAKVLSWGTPSEVYVFGAVHIDSPLDDYIKTVRDVVRLSDAPGYLGAGELHDESASADLAAVVLDTDDVKALKACREGSCDVQLPVGAIEAFRDQIDWSRSDVDAQVNRMARPMLLQLLDAYRHGGNRALGEYRDTKNPARIADEFETMLQRASVLPDVLPELRRYLLDYPNAALPGADSYFYWEKVDFGLKPLIRLNHAVIYGRDFATIALKQLYATHYFHTALDVSVCVPDRAAGRPGFYLLTLKGSQQDGLTGVRGSLLRKVVVDKTRASLERALGAIKRAVERSA
jgi:hypothetical protein